MHISHIPLVIYKLCIDVPTQCTLRAGQRCIHIVSQGGHLKRNEQEEDRLKGLPFRMFNESSLMMSDTQLTCPTYIVWSYILMINIKKLYTITLLKGWEGL